MPCFPLLSASVIQWWNVNKDGMSPSLKLVVEINFVDDHGLEDYYHHRILQANKLIQL